MRRPGRRHPRKADAPSPASYTAAVLDIKLLREKTDEVREGLARLGATVDLDAVMALDTRVRDLKNESQTLQAEQNRMSKEIGRAAPGEAREKAKAASTAIKEKIRAPGRRPQRRRGGARREAAGDPEPAAPLGPRRQGRQREPGGPRGGREARVRLHPAAALGSRHQAGHHRLRSRREDLGLALLRPEGLGRAPAAGAHHVHARSAHAEARLRRDLPALHGQARVPGRHRQPAQVRREPVPRRRGGLLVHPDRRGAGHEPVPRRDLRRRPAAGAARGVHRVLPARADGGRA